MERERTFNADAVGIFPDCERGSQSAAGTTDAYPLEDLDALFVAFCDSGVHAKCIAWTKIRDFAAGLFGFDLLDDIHGGTSLDGNPGF
jgi:hypothetical protein